MAVVEKITFAPLGVDNAFQLQLTGRYVLQYYDSQTIDDCNIEHCNLYLPRLLG